MNYKNEGTLSGRFNQRFRLNDSIRIIELVDNGDTVGSSFEMTRQDVISKIDDGTTFATIYNNNGQWKIGAKVKTVTIGGTRYIKTYSDGTTADNLDDLPTF